MTLKTERTRVRRIPERGHYDKEIIYPIIDEALYCHVGINHNGSPVVIPTIHARTNPWIRRQPFTQIHTR